MSDLDRLRALLQRIDGRPYPAYRDLEGVWRLPEFTLLVDHVQGDPFAAPSRVRLRLALPLPPEALADADARLATEDWLLRRFGEGAASRRRGSGRSGELRVYAPGPEILERSAARLRADGQLELRFALGLPAQGRRVLGHQAWLMVAEDLPKAVAALAPDEGLLAQVRSVQTQRALRRQLRREGLVAFVADGAVLPRSSGVSQAPLPDALPFRSPDAMRVTLDTPHGPVRGMGLGQGISLIVGGGFHGKSTLLQALQRGHLDHVPGDGRERVVADPDTVKVRAEDGRRVEGVDIRAFLGALPGGRSTAPFSSEDASGSTSQAAGIVEAVEAGARVLLMDEDTCATNFMVRDARMRALIPRDLEPITPLVERARQLVEAWGVSLVMVIGGVGDYLAVADRVVAMEAYAPRDRTAEARALGIEVPAPPDALERPAPRVPLRGGTAPGRKVRARDERRLQYGEGEIELGAVEQVLDPAQAWSIGQALRLLHEERVDGARSLPTLLDELDALLDGEGVELLSPWEAPGGGLVRPRRHEVAAALNRLRSLRVR
ncbi:MAG: ABC-ATPase domain-containing protein [Alphaproteobacteria bacterium]|nr:ABC-ATPase domain-containing protein [Alphaproteobacteria bacterium]